MFDNFYHINLSLTSFEKMSNLGHEGYLNLFNSNIIK